MLLGEGGEESSYCSCSSDGGCLVAEEEVVVWCRTAAVRATVPTITTVSPSSAKSWLVALPIVAIAAGVVAVRVICA